MSRFGREKPSTLPGEALPPRTPPNLVPISAHEFARQRRQRFLKWGSAGVIAALVILSFLYRSSIPSTALNNYLDAKKLYDDAKYSDALTAVEPATHDSARRLQAYQLRTAIYRAMNQPKEALADITRVIQLAPSDPENYRIRAQTYLDLDDAASALKDDSKLVELEHSAAAYNNRGLCYMRLKQTQPAIADFTKAIELDPALEPYFQRGLAWQAAGDHRKAIADFDRAMQLRPGMSAAYRARANSREQLGDRAGAAADRELAYNLERPVMGPARQVVLPTDH